MGGDSDRVIGTSSVDGMGTTRPRYRLGFRGLGFRGLGFRGLGFRGFGFRGLGV